MGILRLVCALVAACAGVAFGQFSVTTFDGNYYSTQPANYCNLGVRPNYCVAITEPTAGVRDSLSYVFSEYGDSPVLVSRGFGTWNNCAMHTSARLFFTDRPGLYSNRESADHPNNYWWSRSSVPLTGLPDSFSVSIYSELQPGDWTNGVGQSGESHPEEFRRCARRAIAKGIFFGDDCLYDLGITLAAGNLLFWVE